MLTPSRSAWVDAWEADLTPSPAAQRSEERAAARVHSTRYYTREAVARVPEYEERPSYEEQEVQRPVPELRAVTTQHQRRWGLATAVLLLSALLLSVLVIAPVLINSATTQMESDIGRMQSDQQQLTAETASLSAQISALSSPNRVAEQANRLGLGPADKVHYAEIAGTATVAESDATIAGR